MHNRPITGRWPSCRTDAHVYLTSKQGNTLLGLFWQQTNWLIDYSFTHSAVIGHNFTLCLSIQCCTSYWFMLEQQYAGKWEDRNMLNYIDIGLYTMMGDKKVPIETNIQSWPILKSPNLVNSRKNTILPQWFQSCMRVLS